jgi:ubiquitin C-terminal hydrolase
MEDDWKLFDDSIVRDDVTKADVVSNAGYLLFYRRRDFA